MKAENCKLRLPLFNVQNVVVHGYRSKKNLFWQTALHEVTRQKKTVSRLLCAPVKPKIRGYFCPVLQTLVDRHKCGKEFIKGAFINVNSVCW